MSARKTLSSTTKAVDAVEAEIAGAELRREREQAAFRLKETKADYLAARLVAVSEKLPGLVEKYNEAASGVEIARSALEAAFVRFVVVAFDLGDSLGPEREVAREILACALEVTDGTEAREKLRAVVRHMLPTAVDETGMIDWVEPAEPFLFGGTANGNDPRSEALYSNLGDLCRAGKEKALREMGREVRERVEAALAIANRGTK